MTESIYLIVILSILLVASNVVWMLHCQRLLNKLISRNYHEYVVSREQVLKKAKSAEQPPKPETFLHPKENIAVLGTMISS